MAVEAINRIEAERDAVDSELEELGLKLSWTRKLDGKLEAAISTPFPSIRDQKYREKELKWFSVTINTFVNVFRPRVVAAWEELSTG